MAGNGRNFFRLVTLVALAFLFIWLVSMNRRLSRLEYTVDERTPLVIRFVELETRVLELEKMSIQIINSNENSQ